MLLIVLYHFLEINAIDDSATATGVGVKAGEKAQSQGTTTSGNERGKASTKGPLQGGTS